MKKDFQERLAYLKLLRNRYPNVRSASAEIIRLESVLNLPKGTEHFLSDIHGENAAFGHMLRNASGVIKQKIHDLYRDVLQTHEQDTLCTLVYYPMEKLALLKKQGIVNDEWYRITILRLVDIARAVAEKYTHKHVRGVIAPEMRGLIEEMMLRDDTHDKARYYSTLVTSIIEIGMADALICELSNVIRALAIDRLHIIGDIYDRGPRPDLIVDTLMAHHNADIQWGNHDIVWMGAACGSPLCIAQILVTSVKYSNMDVLEVGYGISLRALQTFAATVYADDPCDCFLPKEVADEDERDLARMHKAIAMILFKLEGQLVQRRPEYGMEGRLLLDKIDLEAGTVRVGDEVFPLRSKHFPTLDPNDPYALTDGEKDLMERLTTMFVHSTRLQQHAQFLFAAGSMYLCCNGNLLCHGCIPMDDEGTPLPIPVEGRPTGRDALDVCDAMARQAYFAKEGSKARADGQDFIWYLWCGPASPLFGKSRMATFERYFIADKRTHEEYKNPYYTLRDREDICKRVLEMFDLDPETGHIIHGHVPVKVKKGESPVHANGRLLVIDGGLSRAYQSVTGIAGYTLIFSSHALMLVAHRPFESTTRAITDEQDIHSVQSVVEQMPHRLRIRDTDHGEEVRRKIADLKALLEAFAVGAIKEMMPERE